MNQNRVLVLNQTEQQNMKKDFAEIMFDKFPPDATVCMATIDKSGKFKSTYHTLDQLDIAMNNLPADVNCYASVNPLKPGTTRKDENTSHICGIYVDIDILHQSTNAVNKGEATADQYERCKDRGKCIDAVQDELEFDMQVGLIPPPTLMIRSGCGLALHYRFDQPIEVSMSSVAEYNQMCLLIVQRFRDLLSSFPPEYEIDVDSTVYSPSHLARIPGTFNTKVGQFSYICRKDKLCLTLDKLYNLFHLDGVVLESKPHRKSRKHSRSSTRNSSADILTYQPTDISAKVPYPIICNAKYLLERLDNCYADRFWVKGSHRGRFIFAYYSLGKIVYGARDAYDKVCELNARMDEPLTTYEVNSAVKNVDENSDGYFSFSVATLISSVWLNISIEDAQRYGFFDASDAKSERNQKKLLKCVRDQMIKELTSCHIPLSTRDIADIISTSKLDIQCSHATVANVQRQLRLQPSSKSDSKANKEITPNDISSSVLSQLQTGKNIFLFGKAGTGKSYIIRQYLESLDPNRILVLSATGFAANNIDGSTIHSAFQLGLGTYGPHDSPTAKDLKRLQDIDVIAIDEISTLRFDIFAYIVRFVHCAEVMYSKHIQLIVVGDFMQLAPVITKEARKELEAKWAMKILSGYAFEAKSEWNSCKFTSIELTHVMRQEELALLTNINRLRDKDTTCIDYFNQFVDAECQFDETCIHLCNTNNEIDDINNTIISKHLDDPSFRVFEADATQNLTESSFCIRLRQPVYIGMRIMTIQNNLEQGYANGSIGTIEKVNKHSIRVLLDNGTRIRLGKSIIHATDSDATVEQLPIIPAYAVTTYKAQGQSFDQVIVHPRCWDYAQAYVAISRITKPDGLRLSAPLTEHDIGFTNASVDRFLCSLESIKL